MPDVLPQPFAGLSVCLFCGSSAGNRPEYMEAAATFGTLVAQSGWRLVYGGGGVGLMGAAARAAHTAGGRVLGVMPEFLRSRERLFDEVETLVVPSMHARKTLMYDQSDVFVVAPGGIGTLEEAIEVLSWRRLGLHRKPMILLDVDGFWRPLDALLRASVDSGMTPQDFLGGYGIADGAHAAVGAVRALAATAPERRTCNIIDDK